MRILITGGGEVGFHLGSLLTKEGHDITIVDIDDDRLDYASNHLDVAIYKGNSTLPSVLKEVGISDADLLITVTANQETNITTAIIGKQLGAKQVIARVRNTEFLEDKLFDLKKIGIDELIIPELLAAKEITHLLEETAVTDTFEFDNGALILAGMSITHNCPIMGKTLSEIGTSAKHHNFTNVAILRDNKTIIPNGSTHFEYGDHAYFITQPQGLDHLITMTGHRRVKINNILILGGSRVGINTAKQLGKQYAIKIIEQDKEKCFDLAELFPDAMVIHGDGRNVDLLVEEGIANMDAFIAVTGNSETNIISSLVAKSKGVTKTIALVENTEYIHLSQSIGIDTLINKKLISANFIFRYIRKGDVLSLTSIYGVNAEVMEFEVKLNSKLLSGPIYSLKFPDQCIIGGVIRKGVGHPVSGDTLLMPLDRVVVLCTPSVISIVEKLFG